MIWSDALKVFLIQMFGNEIRTKSNFQRVQHKAWTPSIVDVVHTPESMDALQTYILQTKGLSATLASLMMYNLMATEFNTMLDKLQQRGITDASI